MAKVVAFQKSNLWPYVYGSWSFLTSGAGSLLVLVVGIIWLIALIQRPSETKRLDKPHSTQRIVPSNKQVLKISISSYRDRKYDSESSGSMLALSGSYENAHISWRLKILERLV